MSKEYWLHRISRESEVSYTLLDKGYLTLGWSDFAFSSPDIINAKDVKEFEKAYESLNIEKCRARWDMWKFAHFNCGDIVVVPLNCGLFSVCRILEKAKPIFELQNVIGEFKDTNGELITWHNGYLKRKDKKVDLGFFVKVETIKTNLKRSEYADSALTSRMKMRQTNGNISDIKLSVEAVISAERPILFYYEVLKNTSEQMLDFIQNKLNPGKFELLVKAYMDKIGADITYVTAKNEPGKENFADADVVAVFNDLKLSVLIQAKHHKNTTDDWAIKQITEYAKQLMDEDIQLSHKGEEENSYLTWVISSCKGFSEAAIEEAKNNNVRLINGEEFSKMLIDVGIANINI